MYLDAADSWIVRGRTRSMGEVFRADYAVPGARPGFVRWCRVYRFPATGWAALCDSAKWLGVHPVRGPLTLLFLLIVAASVGLAVAG